MSSAKRVSAARRAAVLKRHRGADAPETIEAIELWA